MDKPTSLMMLWAANLGKHEEISSTIGDMMTNKDMLNFWREENLYKISTNTGNHMVQDYSLQDL